MNLHNQYSSLLIGIGSAIGAIATGFANNDIGVRLQMISMSLIAMGYILQSIGY